MKKGARTLSKVGEKGNKDNQAKEKEKEKKTERLNQTKKEAWKTIDMLVSEGKKPFWYGFK